MSRRTDLTAGLHVGEPPYTVVLLREHTHRGDWWVRFIVDPGADFRLPRAYLNGLRARARERATP